MRTFAVFSFIPAEILPKKTVPVEAHSIDGKNGIK